MVEEAQLHTDNDAARAGQDDAQNAPTSAAAAATAGRKRDRTLIEFPYADLPRCIELARALHGIAGKAHVEAVQVASELNQSVSGGTFRSRQSAARMFGLIEVDDGNISLTPLGAEILDSATERAAKVNAFLRVPLFAKMYDLYNGQPLPPPPAIERQMITFGVPAKQADRARQTFAASAADANFISPNGRFVKPTMVGGSAASSGEKPVEEKLEPPGKLADLMSDKALEYKLIDLLRDEEIQDAERQAIWTLVQYLTRRAKK